MSGGGQIPIIGPLISAPMGEYANYQRVDRAFHVLWTWAVGQPGYDKQLWKELGNAIYLLATDGPGEHRPRPAAPPPAGGSSDPEGRETGPRPEEEGGSHVGETPFCTRYVAGEGRHRCIATCPLGSGVPCSAPDDSAWAPAKTRTMSPIFEDGTQRVHVGHMELPTFQDKPAFVAIEVFSETPNVNAHARLTVSFQDPDNHVVVLLSLAELFELRRKVDEAFIQAAIAAGPRAAATAIRLATESMRRTMRRTIGGDQ
jgi:hypothetical protein